MKKLQVATIGIFFIIVGILILVYWLILPMPYKQQLASELFNQSDIINISNKLNVREKNIVEVGNIRLDINGGVYYIANEFPLGSFVPGNQYILQDFEGKSNIFSGVVYRKYLISTFSNISGTNLTFVSICKNGKLEIYLNKMKIYEDCKDGVNYIVIPSYYYSNNTNVLEFIFSPTSLISDGYIRVYNIHLYPLFPQSIKYEYFYHGGEVFLYYNFCPSLPGIVTIKLNDNIINPTSCNNQNNPLDITPYLKLGKNIIQVYSTQDTKITMYLFTTNKVFYIQFGELENGLLQIVLNYGEGNVSVNNCIFNINHSRNLYVFNIKHCTNNKSNLLVIEPRENLYISKIILS